MTIQEFKNQALPQLSKASPSPQLDLQVLMEHALNLSKTQLLLNTNMLIPQPQLEWLQQAVLNRCTGLPVAYITGHKEFFGYDFIVSPSVLIPKPDTEILVERAIDVIISKMENHPDKILTICDMCTGSGCIALSVLCALRDIYKIPQHKLPVFTLVDISKPALEIAEKNGAALNCPSDKLRFVRSNLFEQFTYDGGWSFDLILTNPPYIPHTMVDQLLADGRSEPRLALDGDIAINGEKATAWDGSLCDDGLEIIRNLVFQAKKHLAPLGLILMETGEYNAKAAALHAQSHGFKTQIHKDLEGQLRVVELQL